jgi:hypothetical protein
MVRQRSSSSGLKLLGRQAIPRQSFEAVGWDQLGIFGEHGENAALRIVPAL